MLVLKASQVAQVVKNLSANACANLPACGVQAGDMGSIPGSGRCPGGENGNPLQCSCLGNPTDKGAWWAIVHGITKNWT